MPTKKEINYHLLQSMDKIPDYVYAKFISSDEDENDNETKIKFIALSDECQKIFFIHKVMMSTTRICSSILDNLKRAEDQLKELQDDIRRGVSKPKLMKSDAMRDFHRENTDSDDD